MSRKCRKSGKRKALGLTLFSIGMGMLITLILPGWGWLFTSACVLVVVGVVLIKG
ncbi:MAG: hypothetical protein GX962_08355 [Epulopiscium sp.]|nr:hypothetical protein [Candidatus Epulonipiscium sp.]